VGAEDPRERTGRRCDRDRGARHVPRRGAERARRDDRDDADGAPRHARRHRARRALPRVAGRKLDHRQGVRDRRRHGALELADEDAERPLIERLERTAGGGAARRLGACLLAFGLAAGVAPSRHASAATNDPAAARDVRLPTFEGRTLDGKPVATASLGKRFILVCFNPGVEQAANYAKAAARVSPERTRHNFEIIGVALGLDSAKSRAFAARHKLDFPIVDDSDGDVAATLGLKSPIMVVGSDPEGRVGLALTALEHQDPLDAGVIEARIRDYLRIPAADAGTSGKLGELPVAPAFEAKRLDGGDSFRLADAKGRPLIVTFFLPGCSHCQEALRFFKSELGRMKEPPLFVGITDDARPWTIASNLEQQGLAFFPVLLDPDRKVAASYGSFGHVPDIVMIDATGRIAFRSMGWDATHDPDLTRMRLAKLTGANVPMLLSRTGYSGNDACAVCHASETATWHYTEHAFAFETLVAKTADRDPKCVGCHVVGFGDKGGYSETLRARHLEDVGCETCHGRGGGHLDTGAKASKGDYRAACAKCHNPEHSLGFDYATFLPKVSHARIALQSDAERARRIADREKPRDLLPKTSAYAGSEACRSCHAKEHGIWSQSAHAHAVETLEKKGKAGDPKCITCHVTGHGRPGGFPEGGRAGEHADLARVGCESCHGPGAEHVKAGGKQPAGVLKLGDKCDSCVILQICGSCHDDANDPGFRFEVEQKIERTRHGSPASPAAAH
jgi:peroxiredoxin